MPRRERPRQKLGAQLSQQARIQARTDPRLSPARSRSRHLWKKGVGLLVWGLVMFFLYPIPHQRVPMSGHYRDTVGSYVTVTVNVTVYVTVYVDVTVTVNLPKPFSFFLVRH